MKTEINGCHYEEGYKDATQMCLEAKCVLTDAALEVLN